MKSIHFVAFLILVVGGLNWLALGLFGWELGSLFGGQDALISRAIYVVIGLAAVYELVAHKNICKDCSEGREDKGSSQPQGDAGMSQ